MSHYTCPSAQKSSRTQAFTFSAWLDSRCEQFDLRVPYGVGSRLTLQRKLREITGQNWTIGSDPVLVGVF